MRNYYVARLLITQAGIENQLLSIRLFEAALWKMRNVSARTAQVGQLLG